MAKRIELGPGDFAFVPVTYKKGIDDNWDVLCYAPKTVQLQPLDDQR